MQYCRRILLMQLACIYFARKPTRTYLFWKEHAYCTVQLRSVRESWVAGVSGQHAVCGVNNTLDGTGHSCALGHWGYESGGSDVSGQGYIPGNVSGTCLFLTTCHCAAGQEVIFLLQDTYLSTTTVSTTTVTQVTFAYLYHGRS